MDTKVSWHLIYTRPKQEKKIASLLNDVNIENFLPLVKSVRQWHDRKKVIESPLFPSYVFVNITSTEDFYKSSELDGFVSYVKLGKQIAKVDPCIIDNIKIALTNFSDIQVANTHFAPGQNLLITDGPLCGFQCEMIQYQGRRKALVRVQHLSQSLLVDIPVGLIVAAGVNNSTPLN